MRKQRADQGDRPDPERDQQRLHGSVPQLRAPVQAGAAVAQVESTKVAAVPDAAGVPVSTLVPAEVGVMSIR